MQLIGLIFTALIIYLFCSVQLQDDEPPEICVVEGAFTLQTITPTQPMPSIDELDAKFAELVEELDLTAPNKDAMLSLPPQKKWQIYCSRKSPIDSTDGAQVSRTPPTPEHYIERLRDIAKVMQVLNHFAFSRRTRVDGC